MENTYFKRGQVDESISIMREAAQWLIDSGKPLWALDELTREAIKNPDDEFITLYSRDNIGIATCTLSFEDKYIWGDIPANTSGFIHKLAVRRKFAGKGYANLLIKYAAQLCREKNIYELRLDCACRQELCDFYENAGFRLLEIKTIVTKRLGDIDLAMYKL
jgi:GNAT superfamily N-acetyltransferase